MSFYRREQTNAKFNAAANYAAFEESMTESAKESGHQFKRREVLPAGKSSAYCVEFSRESKQQPRVLIRCAVDGSNMYVFFEGDPGYFTDLAVVLQMMSSEATPPKERSGTT